jgi:hypothetical protein
MPAQKNRNTPAFRTKSHRKKPFVFFILLLLLAAAVLLVLELTNTTHLFHKQKVPAIIPVAVHKTPLTQRQTTVSTSTSGSSQASTQSPKQLPAASGTNSDTTQAVVQPYGSFVSSHTPGQNGSSTAEASSCFTSPGASCYIQFSNDGTGVITKLPAQITGGDGSTSWSWDAKILTSGEWTVTAVASQNGQSSSTTDGVKLEVQ